MKKLLLFFISTFIISSVSIAQVKMDTSIINLSNKFRVIQLSDSGSFLTELVLQQYQNNQFENYYRYLYSYNVNGKQTEYLSQLWNNSMWENSSRLQYSYNSSGLLTSMTSQYYDVGWVNSSKTEHTYDSGGNRTQTLESYWMNSAWQQSSKSVFTYDSQSRLIEQVASSYNFWETPPIWVYVHKLTYQYNSQSLVDMEYVYDHDGTNWAAYSRTSYTYTASGKQKTSYTENNESGWVPSSSDSSAYDGNDNLTYNIYRRHNGSIWQDIEQTENTFLNSLLSERIETNWMYDPFTVFKYRTQINYNGTNAIGELHQNWENNQWVNIDQWTMTYDASNQVTTTEMFSWNGSSWDPTYRYYYYYTTLLDIKNKEIVKDFVLYQNYPNPFNSTTKIIYSIPIPTEIKITLFNSLGEEIKIIDRGLKIPGKHEVVIDDNSLSSGVYFYEFQTPTRTESKKMILLK